MRTQFTPLKVAAIAALTGLATAATGQVKIGLNPTVIDTAAILELNHPNKALFLTRVALTSSTDITTVPNPKAGMVVYNTSSSLTTGAGVYYWDGSKWVFSGVGSIADNFWSLNGNSNVSDAANFLGTTNPVAVNFRVNGEKAGRISYGGALGAGPEANTFLGYLAGRDAATQVANSRNTLIGAEAGSNVSSGKENTGVGYRAIASTLGGNGNTALGYNAGTAGVGYNRNTFVGYEADVVNQGTQIPGLDSVGAIGVGAKVSQRNSIIIGNPTASVGIGNTAPNSKLHVAGNMVGGFPFGTSIFYTGIYSRPDRLNTAPNQISYGVLSHTTADSTGTYNAIAGRVLRGGTGADTTLANLTGALGHVNRATGNNFQTAVLGIVNSRLGQANDQQVFSGLRLTDGLTGTSVVTPGSTQDSNTYGIFASTSRKNFLNGSVGIGQQNPTNKLHVTATADPLRLDGVQAGATSDSLLSLNTVTGVVRRVAISTTGAIIKAGNGLTKTADSISLGGTLQTGTTIATGGNNLNLTGAGDLIVEDSIKAGRLGITNNATIGGNTLTGTLNTVSNASVGGNLGVVGAATVGGTLNVTQNTTVTTLSATNLSNGLASDSILSLQPGGVVRRISSAAVLSSLKAGNGLTKSGLDSISLGGSLQGNTIIATNGNNVSLTGLGNLNVADSVVAGQLNVSGDGRITGAASIGGATTIGGALGVTGLSTLSNGAAISKTTGVGPALTVSGGSVLNDSTRVTGLTSGSLADSIVVADPSNGRLRRIPASSITNVIKAGNGLTRSNDSILLGGDLNRNTTIGTTVGGNTYNVSLTGGGNLSVADSVVAGQLSVTGNGRVTGNTTVGGTLGVVGNTTVSTLTATSLPSSTSATDSVLSVNNGVVSKVSPSALLSVIKAGNGLTRSGDSIILGGTLSQTTNINLGNFDLNFVNTGGRVQVTNEFRAANVIISAGLQVNASATVTGGLTVNGNVDGGSLNTMGNTTTGRVRLTNTLTNTSDTAFLLNTVPTGISGQFEVQRVSPSSVLSRIRANNGLTRVGDSIQLGGDLTKATSIGTSAANTIALTGLQGGAAADSVLTIGAGGVIRRNTLSNLGGAIRAGNGLTKTGDSISLGGSLQGNTIIATNGNNVSLTGLGNLNVADSVVAGQLNVSGDGRITGAASIGGATTIGGALGVTGLSTLSNGAAISKTTGVGPALTVSGGSVLNDSTRVTGLTSGSLADSIVVADPSNGRLRRIPASSITNVIKAGNGLTRSNDSILLGGDLNRNTTIGTTVGGNTYNVSLTGGGNLSVADSVVAGQLSVTGNGRVTGNTTVGGTLGVAGLSSLNGGAAVLAGATISNAAGTGLTVNNGATIGNVAGLALTVNGGTVLNDSTRVTGLATGTLADSIVVADNANGRLRRISPASITNVIKAGNGLTRTGDSILLGGTLNRNTTVATGTGAGAFNLSLTGDGNLSVADSVIGRAGVFSAGVRADSLRIASNAGITGNTTIGGALGVTGLSTLSNGAAISKTTGVGPALTVSGGSVLNDSTRVTGLTSGSLADSIVVADPSNGRLRRIPASSITNVIKAGNGLTRTGDSIKLGGMLTDPLTTITTSAANRIALAGLQPGAMGDSLVTVDPLNNGVVRRVDIRTTGAIVTASNGLTKEGNNVRLGGSLTQSTTINTTTGATSYDLTIDGNGQVNVNTQLNANRLAVTQSATVGGNLGVQGQTTSGSFFSNGNASISSLNVRGGLVDLDSLPVSTSNSNNLLNIDGGGNVRQVSVSTILGAIKAGNGLTKTFPDSISLGGTLQAATIITARGANVLNIDGQLTADTLTGVDTASIAALRVGNNATVGGTLGVTGLSTLNGSAVVNKAAGAGPAALTVNGGTVLNDSTRVTGLATGTLADSIVVADNANGRLRRISPASITNVIKAGNGLTRTGDSILLGGTLNRNTTVATGTGAGAFNLSLTGDGNLSVADSVIGRAGVFSAGVRADSLRIASNAGITGNTTIGGALGVTGLSTLSNGAAISKTTGVGPALTVSGGSVLNDSTRVTGLTSGSLADSIVVADPSNGRLRRIPASSITNVIKAGNGLTRSNDSILLGGDLNRNTTIGTTVGGNTYNVSLTGGGNLSVADSVVAGNVIVTSGVVRTDSLRVVNNAGISGTLGVTGLSTLNGSAVVNKAAGAGPAALTVNGGTVLNDSTRVTGLATGTLADSIVVADNANGRLRRISPASITNVIKAGNGLTRTGDSIKLGGTLTNAVTTITTTGTTNTLAISGLGSGTLADSIVVADQSTGVLRRVSPSRLISPITGANGLTREGDSILLGGTLSRNTTINGNQSSLTVQGSRNTANFGIIASQFLVRNRTIAPTAGAPTTNVKAVATTSVAEDTGAGQGFRQVWGTYNVASVTNAAENDAQAIASFGEAASSGTALGGGTKVIGSLGVGHGYGNGSGSSTRIIGSRGYANVANGSSFGAIGVDGFVDAVDGAIPLSVTVGGHFDGTSGGTQFGVIGQVEGVNSFDVMTNPALTGLKIGVAAVNVNGGNAANSLALYTEGNVRMLRLLDTTAVDTVLGLSSNNGNVRRVSSRSILNQLRVGNGLTKVGTDSIRLGGTLSSNTDIALNGNNLSLSGTGTFSAGTANIQTLGGNTATFTGNVSALNFSTAGTTTTGSLKTGSFFAGIRTVTPGTTINTTLADYTIVVSPLAGAQATAFNFPNVLANQGRIFVLLNRDNNDVALDTAVLSPNGGTETVAPANTRRTYQSDGANWYRID